MISSSIVEHKKYEVMSGIEIFFTYYLKTVDFETSDIYYHFLSVIRNHISGLTNELAALREINRNSQGYFDCITKIKFIMNEIKTDIINHGKIFKENEKIDGVPINKLIYTVCLQCDNFNDMEFRNYDIVEKMHIDYLNIWDRLGNDEFYNLPLKKIKTNTKETHIVNSYRRNKMVMFSLGVGIIIFYIGNYHYSYSKRNIFIVSIMTSIMLYNIVQK
jgi:hypothetical protein